MSNICDWNPKGFGTILLVKFGKGFTGYYIGGLASVKVNPELSQNKRHRQWNEQMIKGNI